jgi:FkbM family methyltransferase
VIRPVLARLGLELRRTTGGGPRRTLAEVLAHVRGLGLEPGTVVDVGVAWGTPDLYDAFPGARLLLVEPLTEYEDALRRIAAQRSAEYVLAAAGASAGTTEIVVHRVPTLSSPLGERGGDVPDAATRRTVSAVRLDEVVAERGLPAPYVVKVDVEGAELQVLEGAGGMLGDAELILLEASLFPFWDGAPVLADVIAWMRGRGFAVYDVYGGHLRPLDGALAQLDVAFVREAGPFRARSEYATAEQAERLYAGWGL